MKVVIKYSKPIGIFILLEILLSFIGAFLNFLSINSGVTGLLVLIINALIFFFFGFMNGKTSNKKGFIAGARNGLILSVILFIFNFIIFRTGLKLSKLIYYLILILSSTVGGMFGINKKVEKKEN